MDAFVAATPAFATFVARRAPALSDHNGNAVWWWVLTAAAFAASVCRDAFRAAAGARSSWFTPVRCAQQLQACVCAHPMPNL
jgi:hypothetical protein